MGSFNLIAKGKATEKWCRKTTGAKAFIAMPASCRSVNDRYCFRKCDLHCSAGFLFLILTDGKNVVGEKLLNEAY